MKRSGWIWIALAAALLLASATGCEGTAESGTGPAEGKTLVVVEVDADDVGDFESTTKVGDVTQNRGQNITFTQDASDDRLDATGEMTVNNDQRDDQSSTGWGTYKFTNEGGTWEGDWSGAGEAKDGGNVYILTKVRGTGDYEGLTAYLVYVMPAESLGYTGDVSAGTGWIVESE